MRQLSLLPEVKAPTPSEFAVQCFLVSLIRRTITPQWRFTHLPFGEKRDPATAGRLQAMGVSPGWPDLLFLGSERRVFFLELKRRGAKRTTAQIAIADFIERAGHEYLCTDNVSVAVRKLSELGVIRQGVEVQ